MAKQRRAPTSRSSRRKASRSTAATRVGRQEGSAAATPSSASGPTPRRPTYYEAIALYETGVRALQRHDFEAGAEHFRAVIQRYPDERELLERARLYLRVCERGSASRPSFPRTVQERVYAATIALNAGNRETAVAHLKQALQDDPRSDHAHYIMAVALSDGGDRSSALEHLRQAVILNPDNRPLALQDADLAALRETDGFRRIVDTPQPAAHPKQRTGGKTR